MLHRGIQAFLYILEHWIFLTHVQTDYTGIIVIFPWTLVEESSLVEEERSFLIIYKLTFSFLTSTTMNGIVLEYFWYCSDSQVFSV